MRWTAPVLLCAALALGLPACRGCGETSAPAAGAAVGAGEGGAALDRSALPDAKVVCPVCGLEFNAREAVATRVHRDTTYYFLLEDHARAFAAHPEEYAGPDAKP